MFTGITEAVGTIIEVAPAAAGVRVVIAAGSFDPGEVNIGDSIAVDGACLTAVALGAGRIEFDVSAETLACTAGYARGAQVNLEKSLRLADRLGGHLVSGHVDGIGAVTRFEAAGDHVLLAIEAPRELAKYIARKGSIAVNGVSLTVNAVSGSSFEVNLIPHTLQATNLGALSAGAKVNLEVDMLARYVERIFEAVNDVPTRE